MHLLSFQIHRHLSSLSIGALLYDQSGEEGSSGALFSQRSLQSAEVLRVPNGPDCPPDARNSSRQLRPDTLRPDESVPPALPLLALLGLRLRSTLRSAGRPQCVPHPRSATVKPARAGDQRRHASKNRHDGDAYQRSRRFLHLSDSSAYLAGRLGLRR